MTNATFTLSAFGDEIAQDLPTQLKTLQELKVNYLELRSVDGKNVLTFDEDDLTRIKQTLAEYDMKVSCIGSPIGKSPIEDPIEQELTNLSRIMEIAESLGTRRIRMFSFYPPDTSTNAHYDNYVDEAVDRLTKLANLSGTKDCLLLLENEKGIVGDTPERCLTLMEKTAHPNLGFIWDPANFVQVGAANLTETAWPMLGDHVAYVHIKDAVLVDGTVRPAGEGDGQIPELMTKLQDRDYQGLLALEPHLAHAGHSGGFSGIEGMTVAVKALRKVMAEADCVELAQLMG